jgi:hypothetical protein
MQHKVRWTSAEQEKLAIECVKIMSRSVQFRDVTKITAHDIEHYRGFFFDVFGTAQNVLPEGRRRTLASHAQVPWLIPAMTRYVEQVALGAVSTPVVEVDQMQDLAQKLAAILLPSLVDKVSDAVVQKLASQYGLLPKVENVKHTPLLATEAKTRKPSVIVIGLAANQRQDVIQSWGNRFELVWADGRTKVCSTKDFAVLMTEHVGPTVAAQWKAAYGHRCKQSPGASSSLKKVLNDLYATAKAFGPKG